MKITVLPVDEPCTHENVDYDSEKDLFMCNYCGKTWTEDVEVEDPIGVELVRDKLRSIGAVI